MLQKNVEKLVGFFLGESDRAEYRRLYLDVGLTHYLEFRQEDVLQVHQFPPARTVVWAKPGIKVDEGLISALPPAYYEIFSGEASFAELF